MKIYNIDNPSIETEWLEMPKYIYTSDKNWIPHLKQDIQKVFDPTKNKYFKEGKAERWLLKNDKSEVIGRIAAFHFPKLSSGQKFKVGGIGFFECINDQQAANMMFNTATAWLLEEGCVAVDGPINFGERDAFWGCLTENFTSMSSYRMNYNLPYYKNLFESNGFQVYFEQWCFKRSLQTPTDDIFNKKQATIISDPLFRVSNVRGLRAQQIAENFLAVYNNAWAGLAGFKKMELQQAQQIVKAMKPIMDKDIIIFAYYNETPVGFFVNIPELNEIFQHVNGNLNWWGKLKFLYYKYFGMREIMIGLVFGVDRAYQGKGVESAMIKYAENTIMTMGRYKDTILTWIGDFNPKMLKVVSNLKAEKYRTLVTYRKILDPQIPFERCPIAE